MTELSKSKDRGSFQKKSLSKKLDHSAYDDLIKSLENERVQREQDPNWSKDNLEYDLRTTDWILAKVRKDDSYAQNLYAAMCNRQFQRRNTWPILKDQRWSCSWRYAGGIIADMQEKGDYIDWYCSGIRDIGVYAPAQEDEELTEEQKERKAIVDKFVPESVVTEEIEKDLNRLGWIVIDEKDDNR